MDEIMAAAVERAGGRARAARGALYPGSFDPFTNGHLDLVERALELFDRLVVGVAANPEKRRPLFAAEERVEMIKEALAGRSRVEVASYRGLTVDFAAARGLGAIVKGLRAAADWDHELQQALMNRRLAPAVQTVFLPTSAEQVFVSSSILKDVASHGRTVTDFVPAAIAGRLRERFP